MDRTCESRSKKILRNFFPLIHLHRGTVRDLPEKTCPFSLAVVPLRVPNAISMLLLSCKYVLENLVLTTFEKQTMAYTLVDVHAAFRRTCSFSGMSRTLKNFVKSAATFPNPLHSLTNGLAQRDKLFRLRSSAKRASHSTTHPKSRRCRMTRPMAWFTARDA